MYAIRSYYAGGRDISAIPVPMAPENFICFKEQNLINMIAIHVGKAIERKQAEEALQEAHDVV